MNDGSPMESWTAEQCDWMLTAEVERYNTIRPIAYTNWPTLDPLHHPTEATTSEESAWRKRAGRPIQYTKLEYDNDAVSLDAARVRPTSANPAGWFASFHAYPYYPDFMLYDPAYLRGALERGAVQLLRIPLGAARTPRRDSAADRRVRRALEPRSRASSTTGLVARRARRGRAWHGSTRA